MEFSNQYKHSGLCVVSPDSRLVAVSRDFSVIVRDIDDLKKIIAHYQCLDSISHIEWSEDSTYIVCGQYKRGLAQVWSIYDPEWTCKIDEGAAGLTGVTWAPDSRSIITTSDFQLRLTVWSLVTGSATRILGPKLDTKKGLSFSKDKEYMAMLKREDCKDYIAIHATSSWAEVMKFKVETTDAVEVSWSPDDKALLILDSPLSYNVCIYSPSGSHLASYTAYENALGVKTACWSPSAQFLALGSYDEKVRLLNNATWRPLAEYSHPELVNDRAVFIYEEVPNNDAGPSTRYIVRDEAVKLTSVSPSLTDPNPKVGVGLAAWSCDGRILMTRNDNMSSAVWLWDTSRLSLTSVMLHNEGVVDAVWDPARPRLALCNANSQVYLWSEAGCQNVEVPTEDFCVHKLVWSPDGSVLVLMDKGRFCCCYAQPPSDS